MRKDGRLFGMSPQKLERNKSRERVANSPSGIAVNQF